MKLYPNPVRDVLRVELNAPVKGVYKVRFIDPSGRVSLEKSMQLSTGTNIFTVDAGTLSSGFYYVQVVQETGLKVLSVQKLLKQ